MTDRGKKILVFGLLAATILAVGAVVIIRNKRYSVKDSDKNNRKTVLFKNKNA